MEAITTYRQGQTYGKAAARSMALVKTLELDEIDEFDAAGDAWALIGVIEREGRLMPEIGGLEID